jgi:hypothetical protein
MYVCMYVCVCTVCIYLCIVMLWVLSVVDVFVVVQLNAYHIDDSISTQCMCTAYCALVFFLCAEVCTYMYVYTYAFLSNVLDNWPVGRLRECLKELNEVKGYSKVRNYFQVCIQVCSAWIIAGVSVLT